MSNNGKSNSISNPEGVRRVRNGKEVQKRSERQKNYVELMPKPHDKEGRLIR